MQTCKRAGRQFAGVVLLLGVLLAAGCGQQSAGGPPQGGPPEVAVVTIRAENVTTTTDLAGRTSAHQVAEVRPQVGGIVQRRLFQEGADVKAGQTLYQIDPAPYRAALDNATAALARSEASLPAVRLRAERVQALLADRAVSRQDSDDAAAALRQAEADVRYWKATVETARINLKNTSVTAPISGRIGRSNVTEGALVAAYQPVVLATVQQLDPMYVDVTQSSTEQLQLRRRLQEGRLDRNGAGQKKVRLTLDDGTAYPLDGTLQFRDVTVDPSTGSVILRIVVPNPKGVLLPGMFVRAAVKEGVHRQAILVPQQGVSRDPKGNPVALIVDSADKVQQRMLTLDRAVGDQWLVVSGLAAGDRVIVEGMQRARPGSSVKAVPFAAVEEKGGEERKPAAPPAEANGR
jgi:membrane fusion protein (multidrug efflux system)